MLLLFATTLFLNAVLLFWVQPMFGKMALPLLGGSPSVWTTCMLFFQAALLAGYGYGHAAIRLLGVRRQALLHGVVVWLPLLVLPMDVREAGPPPMDREPIAWLLRAMGSSVGLPFVVLATSAPLLQRWLSSMPSLRAVDPYRLYAASNAGSLVGLLAFPAVVEPLIPIGVQQTIWKDAYLIVAGLLTVCALVAHRRRAEPDASSFVATVASSPAERLPSAFERLRWLALSFAPSSLMLGVTTHLSTDVAAVPLLWIVPLAIYLLTFIVAFGSYSPRIHTTTVRLLPLVLLPAGVLLVTGALAPLWSAVPLHLGAFAVLAMLCHGELARGRPGVQHLTEFYLWLAAGGVLGGVFNTLIAPRLFTTVAEYPLALTVACLVCAPRDQIRQALAQPRSLVRPGLVAVLATAVVVGGRLNELAASPTALLLGAPALVCLSVSRDQARFAIAVIGLFAALAIGAAVTAAQGRVLYADRTFFGVYRVITDPEQRFVSLVHGTTVHGQQAKDAAVPEPLTYFHRQGPIGQIFAARGDRARSVGIVGLGVGTLAAYARPGSAWIFYEIDPAVERIARNRRFFHYLERCAGQCTVALGDARLALARTPAAHDLLVLDAFSSDAIPIHLLTTEALQLYEANLAPQGLLVIHISNRHVSLRPILSRLARDRNWSAFARRDPSMDPGRGYYASEWVVLARRPADLDGLADDSRWTRLTADERPAWSDDFSNIWTALRWKSRS